MHKPICLASFVMLVTAGLAIFAAAAEYNTAVKQTPIMTWTAKNARPSLAKVQPPDVAKEVDKLLASDLTADNGAKSLELGKRAGDEVFLRRVYLDLVGHNPTPDEVTAFVLDPSADKRAKVIDRLLDDPRFGDNWGRYWRDVIMYRRTEDRAQLAAEPLFEYLRNQLNKNMPWDEIARSFITATGDVRENGATGLIMAQFGNTSDITSEVSRIFMGVQIQCANCHDHKTDRWKRNQFHELAAFFPRIAVRPSPQSAEKRTFNVVGNDNPPRPLAAKQANRPIGSPEHFMPDLAHPESQGTRMQPVFFLTGQKLDFGTTDAVRRETIAKWITTPSDEWFAKAFVNRIWAELVGEGFYEPIDDIGPDRTCSAPMTMDYLAHAFADSGFDIKKLYRTIALTNAYERESRSRRNPNETPFVANCPERLRGDQLYDSLVAALGMNDNIGLFAGRGAGGGGAKGPLLRTPRAQFDQTFGYDPSTPRDELTGTIPQALWMMNGAQINRAINGTRRDTELAKLLTTTSDNEAVTTELYLRCLGREPNKTEMQACLAHVKDSQSRATAFEDVLWALVNSTEFLQRK